MIKITWKEIQTIISSLSKVVSYSNPIEYIYGIPKGGLIPAVMLAHRLNIPLLTSKDDMILVSKNSNILIVDDIVDTGKTINPLLRKAKNLNLNLTSFCLYKRASCKTRINHIGKIIHHKEWILFPWETKKVPQKQERNIL